MKLTITDYIQRLLSDISSLDTQAVESACQILLRTWREGRTLFIAGNGGSAGTANHFCCDFGKNAVQGDVGRPRVISLSANIEVLTALGNDFSYDQVFSEQMKNLFCEGDTLLLISASGNSPNIVRAAEYAKAHGGTVIGLTGFSGGRLLALSDCSIHIPDNSYERVEDLHMIVTHIFVCCFKSLHLGGNDR